MFISSSYTFSFLSMFVYLNLLGEYENTARRDAWNRLCP